MLSKKILFVSFIFSSLFFFLPASAKVIFDGTTKDILNIRSGPGTSYKKVGSLKAGAAVQVLEQKNGWDRVGTDRWVTDSFVKRSAVVKSETSVSSDPFIGQTTAGVNVRSGAGTGYRIVSKLSVGEKVSVEEQKSGWFRIGTGKWVVAKYVKKVTPQAEVVASSSAGSNEEDPFAASSPSTTGVSGSTATPAVSAPVQRTTGTASCMAAIMSANSFCKSVASGCPSYSKTEHCIAVNQECEARQMQALAQCPSTSTP